MQDTRPYDVQNKYHVFLSPPTALLDSKHFFAKAKTEAFEVRLDLTRRRDRLESVSCESLDGAADVLPGIDVVFCGVFQMISVRIL